MTTAPTARADPAADGTVRAVALDPKALIFWLVILAGAVFDIADGRARPAWLAALGLGCFAALYAVTVVAAARERMPPYARYALLAALAVVAVAYALRFAHNAAEVLPLLAMAAGGTLPVMRPGLAGVVACAAGAMALGLLGDPGSALVLTSGTATAGIVIVVLRRLFTTIAELRATREELAHAAVARERLRFARDLHDLLGHTLSLIVVKGEIVRRLADRDPGAAAAQAGDIIGIGRAALGEVREAVSGYRTRGVSAELDDARVALDDAGVEAEITRTGPPPPAEADLLLGWVVREAVTNVVRHAAARRCRIGVVGDAAGYRLTVTDDGRGAPGGAAPGNGLTGLAERMAAAGGDLRAEPGRRGGFTVTATLPPDGEAGA